MSESNPTLYFLGPDPDAFRSGGNLYNASLFHAMRQLGWEINIQSGELTEDDILALLTSESPVLIDTMHMGVLQQLDIHPGNRCFLLVHHLPGMDELKDEEIKVNPGEQAFLPKLTGVISNSPFTTRYLKQHGVSKNQILELMPCLELDVPDELSAISYPLEVLVVANLIPRKGILPLLKQLQWNKLPLGRIRFHIAGGDTLNPVYAMQCRSLVDSDPYLEAMVQWEGDLPKEDMPALYTKCDLLVSSSQMESFGMAVMEAIAVGMPVLGLKRGNLPYLVKKGKHGKLFAGLDKMVRFLQKKTVQSPEEFLSWLHEIQQNRFTPSRTWAKHAQKLTRFIEKSRVHAK